MDVHHNAQLTKIFKAMDGKARARAHLKSAKNGREPEKLLISTMPRDQIRAFSHAIDLAAGLQNLAGRFTERLLGSLDSLHQRLVQLHVLRMWRTDLDLFAAFIGTMVGEPITTS